MKVMKKFEFYDGACCLFLIMTNTDYLVDVCEREDSGWSVFRGLFACDMRHYSKALNVFRSCEQFIKEGNRCEDFHVSNINQDIKMKHYFYYNDIPNFENDIIIAYGNRRSGYYYYLCPAVYYEFKGFDGDNLILTHTPTGRDEYINKPVWWADANVMGNFFNVHVERMYGL